MFRPRPVLMDMPVHVKTRIIEASGGVQERLRLRRVCRSFRDIIYTIPIHLESLCIWTNEEYITWTFVEKIERMDRAITYEDHLDGCLIKIEAQGIEKPEGILMEREMFHELAAHDLSIFLSNPKLKIDSFRLIGRDSIFKKLFLKSLFSSKNFAEKHLKIVEFAFSSEGPDDVDFMKFFEIPDKKTIKSIEIQNVLALNFENYPKIFEMDTWKMAKFLEIDDLEKMIPVEKLANFERVTVGINKIEMDDFVEVLEHFKTSSAMQSYIILCDKIDRDQLKPFLETDDLKMGPTGTIETFRREFKNANGQYLFTVSVFCTTIEFHRYRNF